MNLLTIEEQEYLKDLFENDLYLLTEFDGNTDENLNWINDEITRIDMEKGYKTDL